MIYLFILIFTLLIFFNSILYLLCLHNKVIWPTKQITRLICSRRISNLYKIAELAGYQQILVTKFEYLDVIAYTKYWYLESLWKSWRLSCYFDGIFIVWVKSFVMWHFFFFNLSFIGKYFCNKQSFHIVCALCHAIFVIKLTQQIDCKLLSIECGRCAVNLPASLCLLLGELWNFEARTLETTRNAALPQRRSVHSFSLAWIRKRIMW